jgi:adenosylmethionine-8-amino-7-oxononanoate aminotransferase
MNTQKKKAGTRSPRDLRAADLRTLWHPYTRRSSLAKEALPILSRGRGPYLYDVDGRRYLDAISSWWCCSLGHGHPRLVRAIRRQAGILQHSILGNLSHPPAIDVAEALTALLPDRRRVFFAGGDGSCAIEVALKMAVQYGANRGDRGRTEFIALENGYHGDTIAAMSAGYVEAFHRPFKPLFFPVRRAPSPCCGTCDWGLKPETCSLKCFEPMEQLLARHARRTAAVILEPLCLAAGGMRIHPPAYLKALAAACRKYGVLLIVDEIAMGFGRTGRMFAFEHAGIRPDLICLGKALTGGTLPLSAVLVRESIFKTFSDRPVDHTLYHGHTFGGNPIACAAAREALSIYSEPDFLPRVQTSVRLLQSGVQSAFAAHPQVRNVRGVGMIAVVELKPKPGLSVAWRNALRARGVLLRPLGDVHYLMPPLTTPPAILRQLIRDWRSGLDEALERIH